MSQPASAEPNAPVAATPPGPPLTLLIASTLCWVYGVLMGIAGLGVLAFSTILGSRTRPVAFGASFVALGLSVAYCFAGSGLRKRSMNGGIVAVTAAGLVSLVYVCQLLLGRSRLPDLALAVIQPLILGLVWTNWRELRERGTPRDPPPD